MGEFRLGRNDAMARLPKSLGLVAKNLFWCEFLSTCVRTNGQCKVEEQVLLFVCTLAPTPPEAFFFLLSAISLGMVLVPSPKNSYKLSQYQ